jgi:hypothetical protein
LKTKLYILIFVLCTSFNLFPQGGEKKEKIEALRVAFITQQLNLTPDESQKFWPVYNEYQDKIKAARREFRMIPNNFTTDKEAQDFLDGELLLKQRELSLYKEYYEKFKKILPLKKVAQLRQAEEEFKKALLQQLKGKPNE